MFVVPGLAADPELADERSCAPSFAAGAVTNGAILSGGAADEPGDSDPADAGAVWALAAVAGKEPAALSAAAVCPTGDGL